MKILLTGSTGMVGSNILEDPRFKQFEMFAPKRGDVNLFNYEEVFSYFAKIKPDLIIHCAGRAGGIQANVASPVNFLVENLDINRNVILAAYRTHCKKLINFGSSCMYPKNAENPLTEDLILTGELEPTNEGYALAKITAQRLCAYIKKENPEYNYKTIIPCNLYGRFDKFDVKSSGLVPAILMKINEGKQKKSSEVEIWGDGLARREFMYAGDIVDCVFKALADFETLPDIMNVGTGIDYSVNSYYETAAEVVGYSGKFYHDLLKPVGMKQQQTSVDKAHFWGWKSQTTLLEGLTKTYHYFLDLKQ